MINAQHNGEVALVSGANKGIGKEIVRRLAAEGMTVYLGARDEQRGRSAARELAGESADVRFLQLDVTDSAQVAAAVRRVDEECGRLDVLVNNAGIAVEGGDAGAEVSVEEVRRTYEVNVFGVIALTRACLPQLRRSPAGRVVNLSSALGSLTLLSSPQHPVSGVGMLAYSSSKSALNAVTVLYANALRESGILVNAVSPGYVATDLNAHRGHLSAAAGADLPVKLALRSSDSATGTFLESDVDALVPW